MSDMNQDVLAKLMSGQFKSGQKTEEPAAAPLSPVAVEETSSPAPSIVLKRDEELEQLPINLLEDFPNQPIPPYEDTSDEFNDLLESIRINGIIEPLLVRPCGDRYQIISGRNRRNVAKRLNYTAVPCVIREMNDDEAAICLVETIFRQRDMTKVSLMQKAHTYRLWLDAMKRQGRRSDVITSCQNGAKLRSDEKIAENVSESARTIQRFIRLTYLIDDLQELSNTGSNLFPLLSAVEVSYLSKGNQFVVHNFFFSDHQHALSVEISKLLRQQDSEGAILTEGQLSEIYSAAQGAPSKPKPIRKIVLPIKKIKDFLPAGADQPAIETYIISALEFYKAHGEGKS